MAERLADRLRSVTNVLAGAAAALSGAAPVGWSGAGSLAWTGRLAELRGRLRALAGQLESVSLALSALAAVLREVHAETVATRRVLASAGPELGAPGVRQLESVLTALDEVDRRCAAVVGDVLLIRLVPRQSGVVAISPGAAAAALSREVAAIPVAPADPAAVSVWWAGLSPPARRALGSSWASRATADRDGVPARVRDALNRRQLAYAIAAAEEDYARASDPGPAGRLMQAFGYLAPWPVSLLLPDPARRARQRLLALTRLRAALTPAAELLEFDPVGDGRAVIASGDVEVGRSVAVLVPGMSTELDDVPQLLREIVQVAAVAGPGVVAVAWLGYDTPGVLDVASAAKARAAAPVLDRFASSLRVIARSRQHITIIGHSYGTLVAGLAARSRLPADDLVLLGSPGVGADRAAQLGVPAGHVWAARAPTDPIQAVFWPGKVAGALGLPRPEVFGPDPAASAFGARHFSTAGASGHSGYFDTGTTSVENLGRIVSGRPVQP